MNPAAADGNAQGDPGSPDPKTDPAARAPHFDPRSWDEAMETCLNRLGLSLLVVDTQYRYMRFNRLHASMMRSLYGAEVEFGKSILDCQTVEEDRARTKAFLDQALRGEASVAKVQAGDVMSTRRHFEVAHHPIRDASGGCVGALVLAQDITSWMMHEQRALEEQAKLRTLVRTIPDLVWLKDADGVYLFCNQRFETFFGAPALEIVGRTDYDFVDKELADWFREHDRLAMEAGGPTLNEEWVTYASDGHRELLETVKTPLKDDTGRLIGILGVARDVTQNRQDQELLRKLSAATEQSPVAVVITDREGRIEYVNPRFTALTGYTREEATGENPRLLKSGTTPAEVYADLWATIQSGRVWHGELQNRKKDGTFYWEAMTISPICDEAGAITHFVALEEDITGHKRTESELQLQLSELRRWHEATLGRESRILDLKREVNALRAQLGQPPRYSSVLGDEAMDGTAP